MTIEEMNQYLKDNNLTVCKDNIIRDNKQHPKCPNPVFQALVEELQDNKTLDYNKDTLYGQCFLSLTEIVLNNVKFRKQEQDIKDECRLEALDALGVLPKYFDRTKGSTAYSYCYRCQYTNMIHVLERHNAEKKLIEQLKEAYAEELALENAGHKVCTMNVDN